MFDADGLVFGDLFFVLANLLLHFADAQVERSEDGTRLGGRHKIVHVFRGNVDFNRGFIEVLKIHRDFNRVNSIEQPPHLFNLFDDNCLVFLFEVAMTGGYVGLHGLSPFGGEC